MAAPKLNRTTFEVSRELECFSEDELTMQIGHRQHLWPLALLKELVDNALDGCESADIAPVVEVEATDEWFAVTDNGPGLPEATLLGSLDYSKRVSDKLFYVSPSRGQLGNALKTVWAAPFVADGEEGRVDITTQGECHTVTVSLDRIAGRPRVEHDSEPVGPTNGTRVQVWWPDSAYWPDREAALLTKGRTGAPTWWPPLPRSTLTQSSGSATGPTCRRTSLGATGRPTNPRHRTGTRPRPSGT